MNGRGRWLFAIAGTSALAVMLVVLLGALLGGGPADAPPASPTPTAAVSSPSAAPETTPVPTSGGAAPFWVYFARDQLPPIGATVQAGVAVFPTERIQRRIETLMRAGAQTPPAGSTNPAALIRSRTTVSGGITQAAPALSVKIDGDLATVEFDIEDWGVRGAAISEGLVQQLVYTITEESGIRRAMIAEKGKTSATIDQLVVDKPLAREDVFGYGHRGSLSAYQSAGEATPVKLAMAHSVDEVATGLARLVLTVDGIPAGRYPDFSVQLRAVDDRTGIPGAKYELEVTVPNGTNTTPGGRVNVDRSPLRYIAPKVGTTGPAAGGYALGLEDQRPWRAVVLFDPTRIVIDIGGAPQAISEDGNTVVHAPAPGSVVGRSFRVTGSVRAFEATFAWRIRDWLGTAGGNGFGKASIGTSPVWGGYDVEVSVPAAVGGDVTLEVYQTSPRDGSEISKVTIPLTVR